MWAAGGPQQVASGHPAAGRERCRAQLPSPHALSPSRQVVFGSNVHVTTALPRFTTCKDRLSLVLSALSAGPAGAEDLARVVGSAKFQQSLSACAQETAEAVRLKNGSSGAGQAYLLIAIDSTWAYAREMFNVSMPQSCPML